MKTILITGASRGIGAATALLAAKENYAVVVNYNKNKNAADTVVSQIQNEGGTAVAIQADITKEQDVVKLFSETKRVFGNLDILINNAGILERQMKFESMNMERISHIFKTNVFAQFLCTQEAIKQMALSKGGNGGVIVNVSSLASKSGAPGEYIDYASAKGAIDTFTIGLSKEVANEGIRVNAVRPAFIYTDIHSDGGEPDRIKRIQDTIPLKRGGHPKEVAEAILWLASEKSSYCTGVFIDISGGK
ncbi:MAG: SDR family oxidoreductase [Chitinophagaceae bacterium]|nr:SDR family oxidoreductase [Chitinophagaceae bacterium]